MSTEKNKTFLNDCIWRYVWWLWSKNEVTNSYYSISATPGSILDRAIDAEESQHGDFLRLVSEIYKNCVMCFVVSLAWNYVLGLFNILLYNKNLLHWRIFGSFIIVEISYTIYMLIRITSRAIMNCLPKQRFSSPQLWPSGMQTSMLKLMMMCM